ncbi:hypothetical protein MJM04_28170, partial [Salmonella enterica subsp. enterica serovar Cerro]|nr:hypothetical protein [Salmonella enterica subsp. enterica serovar Cerro]
TLTEGKPQVVAVKTFNGVEEAQALRLAAALEQGSSHPLAHAIPPSPWRGVRQPDRVSVYSVLTICRYMPDDASLSGLRAIALLKP